MIRQSSVIQERNALIENLTFVIERIDFRKPFLYFLIISLNHFAPKNAQSWLLIVLFFKEFPAIKRVYTEHYFCLPSVKPALPVALEA